jgi:hypothetical protein
VAPRAECGPTAPTTSTGVWIYRQIADVDVFNVLLPDGQVKSSRYSLARNPRNHVLFAPTNTDLSAIAPPLDQRSEAIFTSG